MQTVAYEQPGWKPLKAGRPPAYVAWNALQVSRFSECGKTAGREIGQERERSEPTAAAARSGLKTFRCLCTVSSAVLFHCQAVSSENGVDYYRNSSSLVINNNTTASS
jgi:hypothetical protein